jgi:hypothetical protein
MGVVAVLGMHRSGTSLATELLHGLGASLPAPLLEDQIAINANGFWEDKTVVEINEKILAGFDRHWYSLDALDAFSEIDKSMIKSAKEHVVRYYSGSSLNVLKDPRLCRLLPFWKNVFSDEGVGLSYVFVLRHPLENALSLNKRDSIPIEHGVILWVLYTLEALKHIDKQPLLIVRYDDFFQSSNLVLADMRAYLNGLGGVPTTDGSIDLQARILSSERHHRAETYDGGAEQIVAYAISLFEKINTSSFAGADMASEIGEQLLLWEGIWKAQQPLIQTLGKTTAALVSNAKKMHRVGELNSYAQSLVMERDRQLQQINIQLNEIGHLHTCALSVVGERDRQLQHINIQLNEIGQLHTHAQSVVAERDRQLAQSQAQCQTLDDENQSLRAHINRIRSTLLGRFSDWFSR